jgi:hypothetical protein
LADYLVHGRSGVETDRVAWTASRNLGTDEPQLAAALMQATARQSAVVQVPVYHMTISFDHHDQVSPDQMQAIADKVLEHLGLAEHQTLMVAHQDRAHAHLHVMVNRIHPETGVAWERWQDRPIIERALREQERAFGLREVPGGLHQIDGREAPDDRDRALKRPDSPNATTTACFAIACAGCCLRHARRVRGRSSRRGLPRKGSASKAKARGLSSRMARTR